MYPGLEKQRRKIWTSFVRASDERVSNGRYLSSVFSFNSLYYDFTLTIHLSLVDIIAFGCKSSNEDPSDKTQLLVISRTWQESSTAAIVTKRIIELVKAWIRRNQPSDSPRVSPFRFRNKQRHYGGRFFSRALKKHWEFGTRIIYLVKISLRQQRVGNSRNSTWRFHRPNWPRQLSLCAPSELRR